MDEESKRLNKVNDGREGRKQGKGTGESESGPERDS